MALHGIFFMHSIIIFLSLLSSSSGIREDLHIYVYTRETGNDFQADPSFLRTSVDSNEFDDSTNLETWAHDDGLSKFSELESSTSTINVDSYGPKADGTHDDSKAFQNAWEAACSSKSAVNLVASKGKKYLLKPITFSGPCKSKISFQIKGTLLASGDTSDYSKDTSRWIFFQKVDNLTVEGGGTIDGNGNIWWQNSCKINKAKACTKAPTAVAFSDCKKLTVRNLKIQNAQQIHTTFEGCSNVEASNLVVSSPETSPNTDGIHVSNTQNIKISSCTLETGDDCISIVSGSKTVQATNITCGPGHGISIGSLGSGNSKAQVSDITVDGATLSGTTNGVRIKTYQGGSGSASNIKFLNVQMDDVKNPIIIDQNYCDQSKPCAQQQSAVQISDVLYQNIKGTSASSIAVNLNCSQSYPCQGIVFQNINLKSEGGGAAKASCNNVKLKNVGTVSPKCASNAIWDIFPIVDIFNNIGHAAF